MEFTVVDAGVAVITLLSGILAYARGFTREMFAIAGWIVAAIAAFFLAPMLEPLIREAPVVGTYLADHAAHTKRALEEFRARISQP